MATEEEANAPEANPRKRLKSRRFTVCSVCAYGQLWVGWRGERVCLWSAGPAPGQRRTHIWRSGAALMLGARRVDGTFQFMRSAVFRLEPEDTSHFTKRFFKACFGKVLLRLLHVGSDLFCLRKPSAFFDGITDCLFIITGVFLLFCAGSLFPGESLGLFLLTSKPAGLFFLHPHRFQAPLALVVRGAQLVFDPRAFPFQGARIVLLQTLPLFLEPVSELIRGALLGCLRRLPPCFQFSILLLCAHLFEAAALFREPRLQVGSKPGLQFRKMPFHLFLERTG